MSYILEALKKADAERERGAVPDLHAQAIPLAPAYAEPPPRAGRPWLWLVAGVAIAAVAALAWRFASGDAPSPPVAPAPVAAPAPTLAPPSAPPPAASPALPSPAAVRANPPVPPAPVTAPAPPPAAPRPPTAKPAPRTRPESRPPPAAKSAPAAAPAEAASAAAPAAKTPSLGELPEELRRQVPPMTIGGSVYSSQPASRMVVVNGQVMREGSTVAPGVVLERIEPKSAVFSVRSQRFVVPF